MANLVSRDNHIKLKNIKAGGDGVEITAKYDGRRIEVRPSFRYPATFSDVAKRVGRYIN